MCAHTHKIMTSMMPTAVVLANDNTQGLLLACRMLDQRSYARVRCSIGGPLCHLLQESSSVLKYEDGHGKLREVKTRVLKRGEKQSTALEEQNAALDVLWLCDWRDAESAWYSLSECNYIFQMSKCTDSKTVAMWLVEVCREDCTIITLQSGLNNSRELKRVFGRVSNIGSSSSINVEEEDAIELEESHQSSQQQVPRDCRESTRSSFTDEEDASSAPPPSPKPTPRISLLSSSSSNAATSIRAQQHDSTKGMDTEEKKPGVTLLAGVVGYGCTHVLMNSRKETHLLLTHHGAICIERLSAKNSLLGLPCVLLLERTGFNIQYRPVEEMNNWLWGDLVWRTFEAYAAQEKSKLSLYAMLCTHSESRLMLAGLLEEALLALRCQSVEFMDPVTSPFGLSFRASTYMLRLPQPLFSIVLRCVLRVRFFLEHRVRDNAVYCENVAYHRQMAPFLNGEVVRIGFESDVSTPLNQEVIAALTLQRVDEEETRFALPKPFTMQQIIAAMSASVAVAAVLIKFLAFVVDVTFYW